MKKIVTLLALVVCGCMNAQNFCFTAPMQFYTDSIPSGITNADFNEDGKADIAVSNSSSYDITVLFGNGTGGMISPSYISVGAHPQGIISADFNGDTHADLAVANEGSGNVSVLLGTGTGSFGTITSFSAGTNPCSVISTDFNGDGILDLAIANTGSNNISVLLGTGTGSFGTAVSYAVGTTPVCIITSDFNGDNKADVAVSNNGSFNISILLGTGTGSFGPLTNFAANGSPLSITSADFNGDGFADIAGGGVMLGTGTGSFGAASPGNPAHSIINADFNGDGITDLATADFSALTVSVMAGNGAGGFGSASSFYTGGVNSYPNAITSADFNGDGKMDIAAANSLAASAAILLNCTITGIADNDNEQGMKIYPNPSNGSFVIETNSTTKQTAEVFDLDGKLLLSQSINEKTIIDAGILSDGVYNLVIRTGDSFTNEKLVIAR